jgi:cyclophilin family peptidyl-prolyl cis-trans isomerase
MHKIAKLFVFSSILLSLSTVAQKNKKQDDKLVLIVTEFGTIKIRLYPSTPLHSENFFKLSKEGYYDSLLFHRVIQAFMIQGGDPLSKNAAPGTMLGGGDIGYTIPAEFVDSLYHKKGALCAARTENPEKASSGCQFYIVQGKTFTDAELNNFESSINGRRKQSLFSQWINLPENSELKNQFVSYQQGGKNDSLNLLVSQKIEPALNAELAKKGPFKYSDEARNAYKTIGGTPHLDHNYTVFGEVVEGLEVIDKIVAMQTDGNNRPLQDVRMQVSVVE